MRLTEILIVLIIFRSWLLLLFLSISTCIYGSARVFSVHSSYHTLFNHICWLRLDHCIPVVCSLRMAQVAHLTLVSWTSFTPLSIHLSSLANHWFRQSFYAWLTSQTFSINIQFDKHSDNLNVYHMFWPSSSCMLLHSSFSPHIPSPSTKLSQFDLTGVSRALDACSTWLSRSCFLTLIEVYFTAHVFVLFIKITLSLILVVFPFWHFLRLIDIASFNWSNHHFGDIFNHFMYYSHYRWCMPQMIITEVRRGLLIYLRKPK